MAPHTAGIVDKIGVRLRMTFSTVRPVSMFGMVTFVTVNFGVCTFELDYFLSLSTMACFAAFCENVKVGQTADWGVGISMAA